ncbi:MAG: endolytic transglycosylase MltG [Deltaproteobacteria bacterium]|nr:endolytic transglycosylase MltG [Deltaproteobacteria bacterium]
MRRRLLLFAAGSGLLSTLAAAVALYAAIAWRSPAFAPPLVVEVRRGEPFLALARRLADAGAIADARLFVLLARWRGEDRHVRSGEYELSGNATGPEVLAALVSGKQRLRMVTIPEGLNLDEIAQLLERAGFGPADRFRALATKPEFIATLGLPAPRLEGYLFPDTYAFEGGAAPEEIVTRMAARFREVFTADLAQAAAARALTVDQAVTLASIVEKEAAVAAERPTISAVFHNRLKRGMPLQSDPTVLYGVPNTDGRIRSADLVRATPYNTYAIPGLPPGPIANPGRASIEAAVRPAEGVTALYFVARNDRTHEFNDTLAAHNRAVNRWQRGNGSGGRSGAAPAAPKDG